MKVQANVIVVADSTTRAPLPNASIFSNDGKPAGISRTDGCLPAVQKELYPITVRYMGYKEKTVDSADVDTIFLQENIIELPEFVVDTRQSKYLHLLAYMRECSTLSTYTDTIFLFREKMVDFMLPSEKKSSLRGWRKPRILTSKSYYRFSNTQGLDSVSDHCRQHFSWTDWVGIVPEIEMPPNLCMQEAGNDTVKGRYGATEIWRKNDSRLLIDIDVLADTSSRKWVPNLSLFFHEDIDFEQFRLHLNYDNVADKIVRPSALSGYSYTIESNGRGRNMFMFNRVDEPFFVSTYAEVYIVDKEYIPLKEAKKWNKRKSIADEMVIYEPSEAPELQESILQLIARVNDVNHDGIRLAQTPDHRLAGRNIEKVGSGQLILRRLKGMFGIDQLIGQRKMKRQWHQYRKDWVKKNSAKISNSDNDCEDR